MSRFNSRRKDHQVSLGFIVWLVCFAVMLCSAGVCIGVLKNEQIDTQRDIERMNVEITSCELNMNHYRTKIATNTSRWAIRDRLAQNKSILQEIQPGQIESIRRDNSQPAMAAK